MPSNTAKALIEKLTKEWPPERISALATSTDPKEMAAGASALRDALMLCTQMKQERPRPPSAVSAKARRDLSEMRETVRKMLRDQEAVAIGS